MNARSQGRLRVRRAILLALVVAGCATSPSATKEPAPATPTLQSSPSTASAAATPGGALEPLAVVDAWAAARNRGDVGGAMELVGSAATMFGVATGTEAGRAEFRSILEGQREAAYHIAEEGCAAAGPRVLCRYRQADAFMDKCGLVLTGEHQYLVYDGKLALAQRTHDTAAAADVYAALDAFRAWVRQTHPDLEEVIWADANSAFYTNAVGARAMLDVLDSYDC